jgi:hypothetical protein
MAFLRLVYGPFVIIFLKNSSFLILEMEGVCKE